MFCGGSADASGQVLGGIRDDHTCFWNSYDNEYSGAILDQTLWREINRWNPRRTETAQSVIAFEEWRVGLDGEMRLYDCEPFHPSSNNVYGSLEGVKYPTQYGPSGALISAGDILDADGKVYETFKDVFRSGAGNIIAMELMGDI